MWHFAAALSRKKPADIIFLIRSRLAAKAAGTRLWPTLSHRLYVSHGTHVVVIDTASDKVVGDIPNTNGVHGIALAEKLGRGFTSNGRDNTVTIFDLKTLKTLGTVKTDKNPDIIIFDPASRPFCL